MSENKKLLSYDAPTGITEIMHFSDDGDTFTVESVQDAEPILDVNKAIMNGWGSHARWGDGKHVASIPMIIYYEWKRQGVFDDEKKLRAKLNDPDNAFLRTFPGRL